MWGGHSCPPRLTLAHKQETSRFRIHSNSTGDGQECPSYIANGEGTISVMPSLLKRYRDSSCCRGCSADFPADKLSARLLSLPMVSNQ